jgi:hypothetical protein
MVGGVDPVSGLGRARWVTALVFLAGAAPTPAFVRSSGDGGVCLWWGSRSVGWAANVERSGATPACDPAASLDAVSASFAAWPAGGGATCTDLTLPGDVTEATSVGYDPHGVNDNLVVFRHGACSLLDPASPCFADGTCANLHGCWDDASPSDRAILALTTVSYSTHDGAILDVDIELNDWDGLSAGTGFDDRPIHGWYLTCSGAGPLCTSYGQVGCQFLDLQEVLTHEVGHFIGLAHVDTPGAAMYPGRVPGETSGRTPSADDLAGVCAIYPTGRASPTCAVHRTGCGCGGGPAAATSFLLLAAALAARPRRATRR